MIQHIARRSGVLSSDRTSKGPHQSAAEAAAASGSVAEARTAARAAAAAGRDASEVSVVKDGWVNMNV
jgi:hypothetical protein